MGYAPSVRALSRHQGFITLFQLNRVAVTSELGIGSRFPPLLRAPVPLLFPAAQGKNRASQEEMEAALLKIVGEPPLSEIAEAVDSVARRKMEASVTISPIGSTH